MNIITNITTEAYLMYLMGGVFLKSQIEEIQILFQHICVIDV